MHSENSDLGFSGAVLLRRSECLHSLKVAWAAPPVSQCGWERKTVSPINSLWCGVAKTARREGCLWVLPPPGKWARASARLSSDSHGVFSSRIVRSRFECMADNDKFHSWAISEDICLGAIHSRSDCLSVFIFLLTVISGRGEREDFKIHLKVIKLALGPLRRAGLSLQRPAPPRDGEVRCPGKLGTDRYLCAPRPRWGGTLLCLFSGQWHRSEALLGS